MQSSKKIYKGRPAGLDVLNADNLRSKTCRHCSSANPDYRPILVKILPVKGKRIGDSSEILQLEVQENDDDEWLPDDFWAFLGGPAHPHDSEYKVPTKYVLSPSEVNLFLPTISMLLRTMIHVECMCFKRPLYLELYDYGAGESTFISIFHGNRSRSLSPYLVLSIFVLIQFYFARICDLSFI